MPTRYMQGRVFHFETSFEDSVRIYRGIRLHQIGENCIEAGTDWGAHDQWCYEISYIISGEGTFGTGDRMYAVRANDVYLSGKKESHTIRADKSTRLRYLYIGFNTVTGLETASPVIPVILEMFDAVKDPCRPDNAGVGELLRRLTREFYREQPLMDEAVGAGLELLLYRAYRNATTDLSAEKDTDTAVELSTSVYSILRYVDDHLTEIADIREIADKLGYSYTYVSHLFRDKTGETLQGYIRRKKLERAISLMRETGMPATKVAEHMGYQSVQSFSKAFHSVYGVSPTEYMHRQFADNICQ